MKIWNYVQTSECGWKRLYKLSSCTHSFYTAHSEGATHDCKSHSQYNLVVLILRQTDLATFWHHLHCKKICDKFHISKILCTQFKMKMMTCGSYRPYISQWSPHNFANKLNYRHNFDWYVLFAIIKRHYWVFLMIF